LIIYDFFVIKLDSDRIAPEIVGALSKVEEDRDYDYT
jgi:hypothetical protein